MTDRLYEFKLEDYLLDKSLSMMRVGQVTLHSPTIQDTLMVNCPREKLKTMNEGWAEVSVDIPTQDMITIYRPEQGKSLQVTDLNNPDGEQLLFNKPIESLTLMKIENQIWCASCSPDSLRDKFDRSSFPGFLDKIARWTLDKQGIMHPSLFFNDECHMH